MKPVRYSYFSIYLLVIFGFFAALGFVTALDAADKYGYTVHATIALFALIPLGMFLDGIDQVRLRKRG